MSRLTIVRNGEAYCNDGTCSNDCNYCSRYDVILQKLAHYEDLEEQGRLIKLPCKVGDTVWGIYTDCNYIGDCRMMRCEECIYGITQICQAEVKSIQYAIDIMERIGKDVFLTKEEAEAKLAELGGKR